jgi:hypothetical protein
MSSMFADRLLSSIAACTMDTVVLHSNRQHGDAMVSTHMYDYIKVMFILFAIVLSSTAGAYAVL